MVRSCFLNKPMRPDQKIGSSDLLGDQRGSGSGLQHHSGSDAPCPGAYSLQFDLAFDLV